VRRPSLQGHPLRTVLLTLVGLALLAFGLQMMLSQGTLRGLACCALGAILAVHSFGVRL
jgi:hypothetical protein